MGGSMWVFGFGFQYAFGNRCAESGFRYSIPAKVNLYGGRAYDTSVIRSAGRR